MKQYVITEALLLHAIDCIEEYDMDALAEELRAIPELPTVEKGEVTMGEILSEVEDAVGMSVGGWGTVDPVEIVKAFIVSLLMRHKNDAIVLVPAKSSEPTYPRYTYDPETRSCTPVEAETCENPKVSHFCDGCAYDSRAPFENPCSFCKMGSEYIKSGRE